MEDERCKTLGRWYDDTCEHCDQDNSGLTYTVSLPLDAWCFVVQTMSGEPIEKMNERAAKDVMERVHKQVKRQVARMQGKRKKV